MASKKIFEIMKRTKSGFNIESDFYEKILNDSKIMERYKNIIQTGAKSGQSLANHVENMVGVLCSIRKIFNISDLEFKILLISALIHDINKVPDYEKYYKYLEIISEKDSEGNYINLIKECEVLGVKEFFPEYEDYMEEIREIIGRHSAHLNNFGEHLVLNLDKKNSIPRNRMEILAELLRAVDVLDLSKTIDEKEKKRQFLGHINSAAQYVNKQFILIHHRVSEDRGLLSNYIHNGTVDFFKSKEIIPIAFYKEGTVYLANKNIKEILNEEEIDELLNLIVQNIKAQVLSDFKTFIKNKQSGINVDQKCFEITSIENIIYEIRNISIKSKIPDIQKKNSIIKSTVEKYKDIYDETKLKDLENKLIKLNEALSKENDKKAKNKLIKEIKILQKELSIQLGSKESKELFEQNSFEIKEFEDNLRFSNFVLGFYNLINSYITNKKSELSWKEFYEFFNLDTYKREYLNLINSKDALYVRPYIVGDFIYSKYKDDEEPLIEKMISYVNKNLNLEKTQSDDMWESLKDYINETLIFSFNTKKKKTFKEVFKNYSNNKVNKCSLCSNLYEAKDWMADDVPYKIKVQNFSNKIVSGSREPKRKICPICQIEYLLHKMLYNSSSEVNRRYISLLPKGFLTAPYIQSIQGMFNEFKYKEITGLYLNSYDTFIENSNKNLNNITPLFTKTKVNGISIPNDSNVFSNYFIMPMILPLKSTNREVWVTSLLHALLFNKYFNCKVIINELPLALFDANEIDEIYIDATPVVYKNLFKYNWTEDQCNKSIKLFTNMFLIVKLLNDIEFIYSLLAYLDKGEVSFVYEIYKKLKKDDKYINKKIRDINDYVAECLNYRKEGETIMSVIKELASFAKKNHLYGSLGSGYLKDNAINKPIILILDNLKKLNYEEDKRALCKREVEKYFERTNAQYFGKTKIENIDIFVDMFIDKLLKEEFKNDLNKLDRDKKEILSVYSYYFRNIEEEK